MKLVTVGFDALQPTQPYVFGDTLDSRLTQIAEGLDPPVDLVVHPSGLDLLVDGHHRAVGHHRLGHSAIKGYVAETDEDVRSLRDTVLALKGCSTVDDVVRRYEKRWLPHMRRYGVTTMEELLAKPPIRSTAGFMLGAASRLVLRRKPKA